MKILIALALCVIATQAAFLRVTNFGGAPNSNIECWVDSATMFSPIPYGASTPYFYLYAGSAMQHTVMCKEFRGSLTPLLQFNFTFDDTQVYTLLLSGMTYNGYQMLTDKTTGDFAAVRVLNSCPDGDSITFSMNGVNDTEVMPMMGSTYQDIPVASEGLQTFQITSNGSVVATGSWTIMNKKFYTITYYCSRVQNGFLIDEYMVVLKNTDTFIRVAHAGAAVGMVDIRINGQLVLQNVTYGAFSDYISLFRGISYVEVLSGTQVVHSLWMYFGVETAYTYVVTDLDGSTYEESKLNGSIPFTAGRALVRVSNYLDTLDAITLTSSSGEQIVNGLARGTTSQYTNATTGTWTFTATFSTRPNGNIVANYTLEDVTAYTFTFFSDANGNPTLNLITEQYPAGWNRTIIGEVGNGTQTNSTQNNGTATSSMTSGSMGTTGRSMATTGTATRATTGVNSGMVATTGTDANDMTTGVAGEQNNQEDSFAVPTYAISYAAVFIAAALALC